MGNFPSQETLDEFEQAPTQNKIDYSDDDSFVIECRCSTSSHDQNENKSKLDQDALLTIRKLEEEIQTMKDENIELTLNVERMTQKYKSATTAADIRKTELKGKQVNLLEVRGELGQCVQHVAQLEETNAEIQENLQKTMAENDALSEVIHDLNESSTHSRETFEEKLDDIRNEKIEITNEFNETVETLHNANEALELLRNSFERCEEELYKVKEKNKTLNYDLKKLMKTYAQKIRQKIRSFILKNLRIMTSPAFKRKCIGTIIDDTWIPDAIEYPIYDRIYTKIMTAVSSQMIDDDCDVIEV